MLGIEIFEKAIIEFGVDLALEYFATPKEELHWFNELKEKERKSKENNFKNSNSKGDE